MYWTNFTGKIKTEIEKNNGWANWTINLEGNRLLLCPHLAEKSYLEVFDKSRLVYFTSDSPDVCENLDPEKIYIIGGIVDHNKYKVQEPGLELRK
jgi:tRNA (guanine9-N1)-methyltransferase